MATSLNTITHRMGALYWESQLLQGLYQAWALTRAKWEESSGDTYLALVNYCNAARRTRSEELRARGLRRFALFLTRLFSSAVPRALADNVFVQSFLKSRRATQLQRILKGWSPSERLNLRRNLFLLKGPQNGERGVLLVQFTHAFDLFLLNFSLEDIGSRYALVLEPSWATYPEPYWALFTCHETPVACEVMSEEPVKAIRNSCLPLIPLALGAQDWVDPELFCPMPGITKEFDVVMIGNFDPYKRHWVLFRAMQKLRPLRIRAALVGFPLERSRGEFKEEIRRFGVENDCKIFERLDAAGVNEILNRSKVNVLLSKAEGGNRALMEAFAANVPCVVYKRIVGPRHSDINAQTGMFADDEELPDVLLEAIRSYQRFQPRDYVMRNTGYRNTTSKLNVVLQQEATRRGERWTRDLIAMPRRRESRPRLSEAETRHLAEGWNELEKSLATF